MAENAGKYPSFRPSWGEVIMCCHFGDKYEKEISGSGKIPMKKDKGEHKRKIKVIRSEISAARGGGGYSKKLCTRKKSGHIAGGEKFHFRRENRNTVIEGNRTLYLMIIIVGYVK
jgi:hypothetical protein